MKTFKEKLSDIIYIYFAEEKTRKEIKQTILALIESDLIGENDTKNKYGFNSNNQSSKEARDEFRQELRNKLNK